MSNTVEYPIHIGDVDPAYYRRVAALDLMVRADAYAYEAARNRVDEAFVILGEALATGDDRAIRSARFAVHAAIAAMAPRKAALDAAVLARAQDDWYESRQAAQEARDYAMEV